MELTLEQALRKGIDAHKAGKAQEADRYYTAVLKVKPSHPDANHNMGVLAVNIGKTQDSLPFFRAALKSNPNIPQFWLSYIDALIKLKLIDTASESLLQARENGVKSSSLDDLAKKLSEPINEEIAEAAECLPKKKYERIINLYKERQLFKVIQQAQELVERYPKETKIWNILGAAAAQTGQTDLAILAFEKVISIRPDHAEAFNNLGNVLRDQGRIKKAIVAFEKAISIKPNFAEAYYNMGIAIQVKGELEKAIKTYKKALSINPTYAEAFNNIALAFKDMGEITKAINACKEAISIKPDYIEALNNMAIALQAQGRLSEATDTYKRILSIKPNFTEAHRNLSMINTYRTKDSHFLQVQNLFFDKNLSQSAKCELSFALAKMFEDLGDLNKAFDFLSKGNALRKKILNYSIKIDEEQFNKLRNVQPFIFKNSIELTVKPSKYTPIFILGMPRSGTTIVEQIISSHSKVTGAGELPYVSSYGGILAIDSSVVNKENIFKFREKYILAIAKRANGNYFVTDKMPQNFRFIPLLCAALPEAKIIHVRRDKAATCWSNFKQYFAGDALGYSYDVKDVVRYYGLYESLMHFWQSLYKNQIYNLDYDKLISDQEIESKRLIEHLKLDWEDICLSPQENERIVLTASQHQIRKKVYKESSQAWKKFRAHLDGAFEDL